MSLHLAQQWAAYGQRIRNQSGPSRGASLAGQSFLSEALGPDARIAIEIAWGADLTADSATWSWTDITGDVYQDPGISLSYGRANEASTTQPAKAGMVLDNRAALYSLGGISPNWPNVKQNVPVRVRIDPNGTGFQVVFQGNAVGFTPAWDTSGSVATVQLEVAGTLRRLIQGQNAIPAPQRYLTSVSPAPSIYYPLNDGALATTAAPALGSGTAQVRPALPTDSTSKFLGKGSLADWLPEGAALHDFAVILASIPASPKATSQWSCVVLVTFSDGQPVDTLISEIAISEDSSGAATWIFAMDDFNHRVILYGPAGTSLLTQSEDILFDGQIHAVQLFLTQDGADCAFDVAVDGIFMAHGSVATRTLVHPTYALLFTASGAKRFFGHLALWINGSQPEAQTLAINMLGSAVHTGFIEYTETSISRLRKLCLQSDVPLDVIGDSGSAADTIEMGPEPTKDLVSLLRESETADQGVLFDGLSAGLIYACRAERENASASLVIDVGSEELFPPFTPMHDDARHVNRVKAKRSFGQQYTYEDSDGPLGTHSIGLYDDSIEVNVDDDDSLDDFASWLVHLGTVEGYRYPTVALNIEAAPHLALQVLALRPGSRIDLVNINAALPGHSTDGLSLFVEGVSMSITPYSWVVTLQCSPFDPWRIITLAAATGDTAETLCHLDTGGSRITSGVSAGATSLTVETTSGPVWTTTADDFPFDVSVGGIKATVTNITGGSSPQTFTVSPLTLSRPDQSTVEVWSPPVLRL
jgi:hypothetical protein